MSENHKSCSICGVEYPATTEYFNPKKGYKFGVSCWCKTCERNKTIEYARKRGAKPKEVVRKDGLRKCPRCQEWKQLTAEFFYPNKAAWDGFHNYCIPCINEFHNETNHKQGRKPLPVRVNGDNKQCAHCEQWFLATTEYFGKRSNQPDGLNYYCKKCDREFGKISRSKRPDYMHNYMKGYRVSNRNKIRAIQNNYRTRVAELDNDLSTEEWQFALDYFNNRCAVCERPQGLWWILSLDHWVAVSKGGGTTALNAIPLCHGIGGCNNSKRDKSPTDWLQQQFGKRKAKDILRRIENYFDAVNKRRSQ